MCFQSALLGLLLFKQALETASQHMVRHAVLSQQHEPSIPLCSQPSTSPHQHLLTAEYLSLLPDACRVSGRLKMQDSCLLQQQALWSVQTGLFWHAGARYFSEIATGA